MLCCAALRCAALCCAVLRCAVQGWAGLCSRGGSGQRGVEDAADGTGAMWKSVLQRRCTSAAAPRSRGEAAGGTPEWAGGGGSAAAGLSSSRARAGTDAADDAIGIRRPPLSASSPWCGGVMCAARGDVRGMKWATASSAAPTMPTSAKKRILTAVSGVHDASERNERAVRRERRASLAEYIGDIADEPDDGVQAVRRGET